MGDGNLDVGWYRFNSSGGWKIPETVVPQGRCSGEYSGWLNGSHPKVGEEEVTRTVCFTVGENTCYWSLEIRVKNCSGYFVYRLWPTPSSNAVYCTDSGTPTRNLSEGSYTGVFSQETSSVPAGDTTSGSSTGKQTDGSVSGEHPQKSSSVPAGDTSPGPGTPTGKQAETSSSGDFSQETSSVPARDTVSGSSTGKQTDGSVSGEHPQKSSSVPAGTTSPDPGTSTRKQSEGSSTGDFSQDTTSIPAGGNTSGSSTGKQTDGSVSGERTQKSSSVPAGDTSPDPPNSKEASQKPSSGPEKETCSVKGLPSKDECEEMINSAQVFIIGKNNLGNTEEQEAYLRQVREMLMEQLPCKHVLPKSEHDNGGGK
ncbi:uncharacterized protein [Hemitrygon akajei]|uniref:uncharacterized protein n=1 Tax=Hemitrygon akajei TaxID=2704970 RepID=UPI003BF96F91